MVVCAAPHRPEKTTNIPRHRLKTNFLPKISLNLAKMTRKPDSRHDKYVDCLRMKCSKGFQTNISQKVASDNPRHTVEAAKVIGNRN